MTKLIPLDEVCDMTGFKKSFIYKRIARGTFPEPIKLGARSSRWNLAEVQEWLDRAVEARHAE